MKKWLLLLSSLFFLSIVNPVFADESCYINWSAAGDYPLPTTPMKSLSVGITDGVIPATEEIFTAFDYTLQFRGANPIGCKSEAPWNNSINFTSNPDLISTQYKSPRGWALFKTSVPGIYFSVVLRCYASEGCGSNHDNIDLPLLGPAGTTNTFPSQSGWPWEYFDRGWSIKVDYFQGPDYKPTAVSSGHSIAGKVGTWRIGSPGQPEIGIVVTDTTLQFNVPIMTCELGQLSGHTVSGNNVNLGTYFVSDIKNNKTTAVPFTIATKLCNASIAAIKMTSNYLPPPGVYDLLGKSAGSASGVAVKIMNTDYNVQMDPAGMVNVPYGRNNDWTQTTYFNFSAQVLGDGTTVRSGDFKTAATFILSYN